MKKLFLLLTAGIVTLSATAQQRLNNGGAPFVPVTTHHEAMPINAHGKIQNVHKTTTGLTQRWYNYVDFLDLSTSGSTDLSAPYLWNDTTSVDAYSGGVYANNTTVSIGSTFDPYIFGFYDDLYYPTATNMQMTPSNAYVVDSITIYGSYGTNPGKTAVVDTLTIGYTYGTGIPQAPTSDIWKSFFTDPTVLGWYGLNTTDTLWFKLLNYDSVANTGAGANFNKHVITISSAGASDNSHANWGDTLTGGTFAKTIALPTPMNVPAGSLSGFTISFKSGDASFTADDTVFTGNAGNPYKYNMFRPLVGYMTAGGSTPAFANYDVTDENEGHFKTLPNFENGWKNVYVPMYAWSSGSSASTLQFPYIDVHVKCATCDIVATSNVVNHSTISVYPNPARNEVKISGVNGIASVSLTNMVGQIVAVQNVLNGMVVFNTSALPAGIYIYTVSGDVHATGRVVVAH